MPARAHISICLCLVACSGTPEPAPTTDAPSTGTGTTLTPTGSPTDTGTTGPICVDGETPDPGTDPLRCSRCVVVDQEPGFCADGVFDPVCVDGVWMCVDDTIPEEACTAPGDPCELAETGP